MNENNKEILEEINNLRLEIQAVKQELKTELEGLKTFIKHELQNQTREIREHIASADSQGYIDIYDQIENIDRQASEEEQEEFFERMKNLSKEIMEEDKKGQTNKKSR